MIRKFPVFFLALFSFSSLSSHAQPSSTASGVQFTFAGGSGSSVSLIGDFNGWSAISDVLAKGGDGNWSIVKKLSPGTYQYSFLLDGSRVVPDPKNDATVQDAERSRTNSVITVAADGSVSLHGYPEQRKFNDTYEKKGGTVFLNLIWRFHEPWYYNVQKDQISAPFIRIHATKDYYDMAANVEKKATVHITAALSPSMLWQLQNVYVARLGNCVHKKKRSETFDAYGFLSRYRGKTDPWIDLCLKPAGQFTAEDKATLYKHPWGIFSNPPVQIGRFPQLNTLYEKWKDAKGDPAYSEQEIRALKFWAIFAHFDPEFYERKIPLPDKRDVDFRDLVSFRGDGKYYLKNDVTEEDCQRVIFDAYKVMASIVPKYQKIKYNPRTKSGQIEIAGTSFFDAPVSLLINTKNAQEASSSMTLPTEYAHAEDAEAQLSLALAMYDEMFESRPRGYVPSYGMLSNAEIPMIRRAGYKWLASDERVLTKSDPGNQPAEKIYAIADNSEKIAAAFGESELANRVRYQYRYYYAENAADDFITHLLSHAPENPADECVITAVIDGASQWGWYVNDIDGQGFINSLYRKLDVLSKNRAIVTTTMSEYLDGNMDRGVRAHPLSALVQLTKVGAGSAIDGSFNAWIGERSVNTAWEDIATVRNDLQKAGVTPPASLTGAREGSADWYRAHAYLQLLAAQGQDWFLRFGAQGRLLQDPKPYETVFLTNLKNVYYYAQKAGVPMTPPALNPVITAETAPEWTKPKAKTRVTFHCTLRDREAITAVYVAGNRVELADGAPNTVRMWDNAEYGDAVSGDNIWTLVVDLEEGPLEYKYTNSGGKGTWEGTESFEGVWRHATIAGDKMTLDDVFGAVSKEGK